MTKHLTNTFPCWWCRRECIGTKAITIWWRRFLGSRLSSAVSTKLGNLMLLMCSLCKITNIKTLSDIMSLLYADKWMIYCLLLQLCLLIFVFRTLWLRRMRMQKSLWSVLRKKKSELRLKNQLSQLSTSVSSTWLLVHSTALKGTTPSVYQE